MTDLERRALLGDRQAQEGCTRRGILLPGPFCGGSSEIHELYEKKAFAQLGLMMILEPTSTQNQITSVDTSNRKMVKKNDLHSICNYYFSRSFYMGLLRCGEKSG